MRCWLTSFALAAAVSSPSCNHSEEPSAGGEDSSLLQRVRVRSTQEQALKEFKDPWYVDLKSFQNVSFGPSLWASDWPGGLRIWTMLRLPLQRQVLVVVSEPRHNHHESRHDPPAIDCRLGLEEQWRAVTVHSSAVQYPDSVAVLCPELNSTAETPVTPEGCVDLHFRFPKQGGGFVFQRFEGLACDLGFKATPATIPFIESKSPLMLATNKDYPTDPLRLMLTWVEYHLHRGVGRIFIYLFRYQHPGGGDWRDFFLDFFEPYRADGRVVLLFVSDHPPANSPWGYQWQCPSNMITLYLNRDRAEWLGTHDWDEFMVPHPFGTWPSSRGQLPDLLHEIDAADPSTSAVVTHMLRVQLPDNRSHVVLEGDRRGSDWMPKCHKMIVKLSDCAIPWVHWCTKWLKDGAHTYNKPWAAPDTQIRINHYRPNNMQQIEDFDRTRWSYDLGEAGAVLSLLHQRLKSSLWDFVDQKCRPLLGRPGFEEMPKSCLRPPASLFSLSQGLAYSLRGDFPDPPRMQGRVTGKPRPGGPRRAPRRVRGWG